MDVTLTDRTIKCRVEIEELDKVVSSIPKDASEKEKEIIKTAQGYVTSSHMSYDGIVKQLEYEGYSYDEATYGAEYCGADWKEQAVKAAKSYMSIFPEFTKDKLVEQLEYDGFSNENAIYAGDNFNTNAVTSSSNMFYNTTNLVGGAGTTYNSSFVDKTYARIDGGTSKPGYFTLKN